MDPLDAERWDGPPAPEGSAERIEARRRLWMMARRQIRVLERDPADWIADVRRHAPQLAGAVGDADLYHLAACARRLG